jgi:hypothetical protein
MEIIKQNKGYNFRLAAYTTVHVILLASTVNKYSNYKDISIF